MTDRLTEILLEDLPILCDLYRPDGKKSYVAYMTICNYISWVRKDSNLKHVKFYCLNDDYSDGTFVVIDRYQAYTDTFNESHDVLTRLLVLLDYSKGYNFLTVRHELQPVVAKAIKLANIELLYTASTLLYYLPKEDAMKLDDKAPDGIKLHALNLDSDLEKANEVWPHRHPGSIHFFKRAATYNVNVGAYKDDGTLVSWIFRLQTGLLTTLQTDQNHLGHGYGTIVLKYLSKRIAETGHDIYAGIIEDNHPSRNLFEKLGFKSIGEVHWMLTKHNWTEADE